jgi:dipeptidyl aminopeptidase/acylaminoacyl peptidase
MKALSASMAALFVALTLLIVTPLASATFSGENGRILFGRTVGGHAVLFTVGPGGNGLSRLTNPPPGVNTIWADWSPNGRWLAYTRLGEEVQTHIFRIRRDGTHRQNLSKKSCLGTCTAEQLPAWSPDGTRIAYVREASFSTHWRIYVKDADGRDAHQVVPSRPRARDHGPQWSPSGKRLVFARFNFRKEERRIHGAPGRVSPSESDALADGRGWLPRLVAQWTLDPVSELLHRDRPAIDRLAHASERRE